MLVKKDGKAVGVMVDGNGCWLQYAVAKLELFLKHGDWKWPEFALEYYAAHSRSARRVAGETREDFNPQYPR